MPNKKASIPVGKIEQRILLIRTWETLLKSLGNQEKICQSFTYVPKNQVFGYRLYEV